MEAAKKKIQDLINQIPDERRRGLNEGISKQHIAQVSTHFSEWEKKSDLLGLDETEVPDIRKRTDDPVEQREAALRMWMKKAVEPTYGSLLEICVKGGMLQCAKMIVDILSDKGGTRTQEAEALLAFPTSTKEQKYKAFLDKIPTGKRGGLDVRIKAEGHLRRIAQELVSWDDMPDLLGLNLCPHVSDIKANNRDSPYQQRRAALEAWRNSAISTTFRSLLHICVEGNWEDCAQVIIDIIKEL